MLFLFSNNYWFMVNVHPSSNGGMQEVAKHSTNV